MNVCGRIGLGTVQWGMPYGIANQDGPPGIERVGRMLDYAHAGGIDLLDTAHVYGDAEGVIGAQQGAEYFKVVTKTLPLQGRLLTEGMVASVCEAFELSLSRLSRGSVYGLLIHHVENLLAEGGKQLWQALTQFKVAGKVIKLGVSVYRPDQLRWVLDHFPVELVQLPFNIYDQRFARSGLLAVLKQQGIEVHARSAFLQGLLLLPANRLVGHFLPFRKGQELLHGRIQQLGLNVYQACLNLCLGQREIDRVIVGCENSEQVKMLVSACGDFAPFRGMEMDEFSVDDESLINPSLWPKQGVG